MFTPSHFTTTTIVRPIQECISFPFDMARGLCENFSDFRMCIFRNLCMHPNKYKTVEKIVCIGRTNAAHMHTSPRNGYEPIKTEMNYTELNGTK